MYKHMGEVVIKILQGSAVTQTVLGGLTIYLLVAMCQKLWKLALSRQSYCKNYLAYFFWPTLYSFDNIAKLSSFLLIQDHIVYTMPSVIFGC